MNTISVIIIDDHPLFRQGVADALSIVPDITVIGQVSDGREGLESIRKMRPDVAVIDVNLPSMNGHQIARQVKSEKILTKIILLTAYDDAEQEINAIKAGASAYCNKDVQADYLVEVIQAIASGRYVVKDQILEQANIETWLENNQQSSKRSYSLSGEPRQPLSAREMEVLLEITHGKSNKEIAFHLGISHQTVKNHVTSILRKLDVEDRTQAAIHAIRQGWVRLNRNNSHNQELRS